jgi:acyl-coenzyme A thioesterase PaaI-like protein
MSKVVDLYEKAHAIPVVGDRIFSFAFSQVAPYFWTIRPRFTVIEPNHAEVVIPKRRGVKNHIGTVHAIALCNGLEAAMGVLAEASIPQDKRWIPKGMEVSYTAKATTDITCIAETDPGEWTGDALPEQGGDVAVRVRGVRTDGTVVIEGTIRLWVAPKKA